MITFLILSSISLVYFYIEKSFQIDEVSPSNNNSLIQNSNNGINSRNNNNLYKTNNNKITNKKNNNKNNNIIKRISINTKLIKNNNTDNSFNINNSNNNNDSNSNQINNILITELNSFYTKLIFSLLKRKIKNLCAYLGKDDWKKINIHDLNELINRKSIKLIKYKDFLTLPFKNITMDKNTLKNHITNLMNFKEGKNIKINLNNLLNKKINERNLLFSASSFILFQYILDIYSYSFIIPSLKMTIINNIFILYDYFLYSTMHMFYKNKLNIDEIKQKIIINKNNSVSIEQINSKSKNIEFVQKYINLISFLFEYKKDSLVKIVGNEKALFTIQPILNQQIIKKNDSNNINIDNFLEKIICFEACWTVFKLIKRLTPLNKSNNGNELYNIKINRYKIILSDMQHFIYYPISINLIKNSNYVESFIKNKWQINTNNKTNKSKMNIYIQIMIENIKDITGKLTMLLPLSLKSKIRFIYIFIISMLDLLKENISQMNNLNKSIINIIIQDFKIFKNKLNDIINCNDNGNEINNKSKINLFDTAFNNFLDYLNNILVSKDKFINNICKNKIPLHLANNLLNINKIIADSDKNKIKSELKCNYEKEMKIINDILIKFE